MMIPRVVVVGTPRSVKPAMARRLAPTPTTNGIALVVCRYAGDGAPLDPVSVLPV